MIICLPLPATGEPIVDISNTLKSFNTGINCEFYGSLNPGQILSSGRGMNNALLPQFTLDDLSRIIKTIHNQGYRFNYVLNASCSGNFELTKSGRNKIINFIGQLIDAGIDAITMTLPAMIQLIHHFFPGLELCASTIIGINSLLKIKQIVALGASRIILPEDENRNFTLIKSMTNIPDYSPGYSIEVIANPKCRYQCVLRSCHYNSIAHENNEEKCYYDYYTDTCSSRKEEDFLKIRWIRPEDLQYYQSLGINYFKFTGRTHAHTINYSKLVSVCAEGKHDGNLLSYLYCFDKEASYSTYISNTRLNNFIRNFPDNSHCVNNCEISCSYCKIQYLKTGKTNNLPHNRSTYPFINRGITTKLSDSDLRLWIAAKRNKHFLRNIFPEYNFAVYNMNANKDILALDNWIKENDLNGINREKMEKTFHDNQTTFHIASFKVNKQTNIQVKNHIETFRKHNIGMVFEAGIEELKNLIHILLSCKEVGSISEPPVVIKWNITSFDELKSIEQGLIENNILKQTKSIIKPYLMDQEELKTYDNIKPLLHEDFDFFPIWYIPVTILLHHLKNDLSFTGDGDDGESCPDAEKNNCEIVQFCQGAFLKNKHCMISVKNLATNVIKNICELKM